jgi:hypothetical protein
VARRLGRRTSNPKDRGSVSIAYSASRQQGARHDAFPRRQGPLRQAHSARTAAAVFPVRRAVPPVSWPLQTRLRQPLNGGH